MHKYHKHIYIIFFLLSGVIGQECYSYSIRDIMTLPSEEILIKGDTYFENDKIDSALIYYVVLSGKYSPTSKTEEKHYAIQGFIKTGDIYYNQGNYHNALEVYFKGFKICENENIDRYLPELYKNMGNIYNKFKDYERGKDYYEKGLEVARKINDTQTEWKILTNLVGICCYGYLNDNDIEEAKKYYKQAKELLLTDSQLQEYYNLLNQGYIYNRESKKDSAIIYYQQALEYAIDAELDSRYISSSATELAVIYEESGAYEKALQYHLYSNNVNQKSKQIDLIMYSLENLSVIYEKIGDSRRALYYKNEYLNASDSIFNIREFNRVKNSQLVYEMDKINEQMDHLNAEKEESDLKLKMQKRILLIASGGLTLLSILLIILYFQKKKLEDAYIDLFERNDEILRSATTLKNMRTEYENMLQKEKEKNKHLREELKNTGYSKEESTSEAANTENEEEISKIRIDEEQKEKIIKGINNVMENTLEFCDFDFSLSRLATLIGTNTKYVSQIINEHYNKNFRTFVNEYRIREASIRLRNTAEYGNYTIKAVAESVGYKSHTTFIATFKKMTGINPSTYQKIAQKQSRQE